MTAKDSKDIEEEVPEGPGVEIPESQKNLTGADSASIAPEQLEQALVQQAGSITEEVEEELEVNSLDEEAEQKAADTVKKSEKK